MAIADVEQLSRQLLQVQGIARTFERRLDSLRIENRELENKNINLITVNQDLKKKLEKQDEELRIMREWLKK